MASPRIVEVATRKTRIVCVSDTHSASPADGAFKLPKGDVLIHAGDLTNQGTYSELKKTLDWIEASDFEVKIVIAGNHDITLDAPCYAQQWENFHNQNRQSTEACLSLLDRPSIVYLNHSSAIILLQSPNGPRTTFTVFGSPYVPARGNWAFSYDAQDHATAATLWDAIPLDTDIVVTHTPAYNHCDASPRWGAAGCEELRKALWRVRPRIAVCGHVHEARGAERVKWKLGLRHVVGLESGTEAWEDPGAGTGNKKMSLLDSTGRTGAGKLDNDGASTRDVKWNVVEFQEGKVGEWVGGWDEDEDPEATVMTETTTSSEGENSSYLEQKTLSPRSKARLSRLHQRNEQALAGRMGRKETCFVNAAIMARSFGNGPKRFNKPIVIDIDLPVWQEEKAEAGRRKSSVAKVVSFRPAVLSPVQRIATGLVPVAPRTASVVRIPTHLAPASRTTTATTATTNTTGTESTSETTSTTLTDSESSDYSVETDESDESIYNSLFSPTRSSR